MKKSDEIKKSMDDLLIRAESIQNVAAKANEGAGRDLTEDEQKSWNDIMAKETGQIAKLEGELKAALLLEEEQARLRSLKATLNTPNPVFDQTGGQQSTPPVPLNIRLLTPNLKAFQGAGDKIQAQKDAYDTGLWFKSYLLRGSRPEVAQAAREKLIARRGMEWFATQNETTPTDGGYLVPPQFENAVIVYREQVGVARRLARVVPMSSDTWTGMKQTSGTTVYYPGEEGAIPDSDANFSRYTLSAKKRAILTYVSAELRDDALVSVMDLLAQDMGHQFALKEDQEFVAGDGTSTYGGVQGVRPAVIAATASVYSPTADEDAWSEVTLATLLAGVSLVADKYRGLPLSWLISAPAKWQIMDRLALAQGGAIMQDIVNGQPQFQFLGYPVVLSDRMPTTEAVSQVFALFGAFGNAVTIGDRSGISIAVSEHYKFNTDQIAVRGTTRYDINVHEAGSTSAAGAIVGVATHS